WRLATIVVVWLAVFSLIARYFLPRVRRAAAETAEASSVVTGRLVDGYSNIQTLKLFGSAERDDAYMRQGMQRWLDAIIPLTRGLSGIRIALGATSGVMICA
ncbi:ABC transporter ATP-binding protein, partial [Mycobacterium tuberculosis]|nr:ABC transporter ATP-binding protein [Mycobacterium tuberculosis]